MYPEFENAVRPDDVPAFVAPAGAGAGRKGRSQNGGPPPVDAAPAWSAKDRQDLLPRMFYEVFVLANVDEVVLPPQGQGPEGTVEPPTTTTMVGSQQPTVSR